MLYLIAAEKKESMYFGIIKIIRNFMLCSLRLGIPVS